VLNLGVWHKRSDGSFVETVKELARKAGVREIDIIEKYLEVSGRVDERSVKDYNGRIMQIINDRDKLKPRQQIEKLREISNELEEGILSEFASAKATISSVKEITSVVINHSLLRPAPVDVSGFAIVMKKDLPELFLNEGSDTDEILKNKYSDMKRALRKTIGGGGYFVEVDGKDELVTAANRLIREGRKVIIFDDDSLTSDIGEGEIDVGTPDNKNCCVVKPDTAREDDGLMVSFLNLNAMFMMGVGLLDNDEDLFEMAYKLFTGRDVPESVIVKWANKTLWVINALPRMVRLPVEKFEQQKTLRSLFSSAA